MVINKHELIANLSQGPIMLDKHRAVSGQLSIIYRLRGSGYVTQVTYSFVANVV